MYQTPQDLMEVRIQHLTFTKERTEKKIILYARIITSLDEKKRKLISLLANDIESGLYKIIAIYRINGKLSSCPSK